MVISINSNMELPNHSEHFSSGFHMILSDHKDSSARLHIISNALWQTSQPHWMCRTAFNALLKETTCTANAWKTLDESLGLPVVQSFLADNLDVVQHLLQRVSSVLHSSSLGRLQLDGFSVEQLMVLIAYASELLQSPGAYPLTDIYCRLGSQLELRLQVNCSEGVKQSYVDRLLVPSVLTAVRFPALSKSVNALFRSVVLNSNGTDKQLLALCLAEDTQPSPAAKQLLDLFRDPDTAEQMLTTVLSSLLSRCTSCPLPVVAFWSACIGIVPQSESGSPLLCPWQNISLSVPTELRLSLFCRVLRALRDARAGLSSAWRHVTVLQWLRASAVLLLNEEQWAAADRSSVWYQCMCEMMSISPHSIQLASQLGSAFKSALTHCRSVPGADEFIQLTFSTYTSLHQLPKLIPRLVLSCRDLSTPLVLTEPQVELLGQLIASLPQQHTVNIMRTMLYHLKQDILEILKADAESGGCVVALVFQLMSVVLDHAAFVDQNKITAAVQAMLPEVMAEICHSLSAIGTLVCEKTVSSTLVSLFMSTCVSWKRVQSLMLHFCAPYRDLVSGESNVTSSHAPLSRSVLVKLCKLVSPHDHQSTAGLWDMYLELQRAPGVENVHQFTLMADSLPKDGRLQMLEQSIDYGTISAWVQSTSRLDLTVEANSGCVKLHLAVLERLASCIADLPLSTKRRRGCDVSMASFARRLQRLPSIMASADRKQTDLWTELDDCLRLVGQYLEASSSTAYVDCGDEVTTALLAVRDLPLECLSPSCASYCFALLLFCAQLIDGDNDSELWDLVFALLPAVVTSVRDPRPFEVMGLFTLLKYLCSNKQPADGAFFECYWGKHAALLAPVTKKLSDILLVTEGAVDQRLMMRNALPLLRHLLLVYRASRNRDKAVKSQVKALTSAFAKQIVKMVNDDVVDDNDDAIVESCTVLIAHGALKRIIPVIPAIADHLLTTVDECVDNRVHEILSKPEWDCVAAFCSIRAKLGDLPMKFFLEMWNNVLRRSSSAETHHVRSLLQCLTEEELVEALQHITKKTLALNLRSKLYTWRLTMSAWASVGGSLVDKDLRHHQRLTLHRFISWLTHLLARHSGGWAGQESPAHLLAALHTLSSLLAQRNVRLSDTTYCSCLLACSPDLGGVAVQEACSVLLAVCDIGFHLVSVHPDVVSGRVPATTQLVQYVAQNVCRICVQQSAESLRSSAAATGDALENRRTNISEESGPLLSVANQLGRLVREIVGLGADTQVLAPFLIADFLAMLQQQVLPDDVQEALDRCVYAMFSQCRDEVITRLRATLPASSCQLFDIMLTNYKRFHKFTGRV